MRVSYVGMCPTYSFRKEEPRGIYSPMFDIVDAMKLSGHVVNTFDSYDDSVIKSTDVLIVAVMTPTWVSHQYFTLAMNYVGDAIRENVPLVFIIHDWNLKGFERGTRNVTMNENRYFECSSKDLSDQQKRAIFVGRLLLSEGWPDIAPLAYAWGDDDMMRTYHRIQQIFRLDPTAAYRRYLSTSIIDLDQRSRGWLHASWHAHRQWFESLGLKWPIIRAGHSFGRYKFPKVPEDEIVRAASRLWGVACPPYYHLGFGWWRGRHVYATEFLNVVLCEPGEMLPLRTARVIDYRHVEQLEIRGLRNFAATQRDEFSRAVMSLAEFVSACDNMVVRATPYLQGA